MGRNLRCYNWPTMTSATQETPGPINAEGAGSSVKDAALMVFASICYSLMPLSVVLSGGQDYPFLFNMGWRGGIAIGYVLIMAVWCRKLFFSGTVWKIVFRQFVAPGTRRRTWLITLLIMVAYFNTALFARSINYLDISAAIMLAAISPAVIIFIDRYFPHIRNRIDHYFDSIIERIDRYFIRKLNKGGATPKGEENTEGGATAEEPEKGHDKEDEITWYKLSLVFLGLVGAAIVVFGQLAFAETESGTSGETTSIWLVALGVALATGSAVIYSFNRRCNDWVDPLKADLEKDAPEVVAASEYNDPEVETQVREKAERKVRIFCATVPAIIASLAVVPLCLLIGIDSGENLDALLSTVSGASIPVREILPVENVLILIVVAGALTFSPAGLAWRTATSGERQEKEINAVEQIRPVLSLLWFLPFTFMATQPVRVKEALAVVGIHPETGTEAWNALAAIGIHLQYEYLITGVILIGIANLLLIFGPERTRWGFRSLMIALGICGTFVYFREDIFTGFLGEDFLVTEHYFESVGLAATVFTLLLAFRVANLVTRSHAEEAQAFGLFRRLEMLVKLRQIDPAVLDCVIRIDAPKNRVDLETAYAEARRYLASTGPTADTEERIAIYEAQAGLDAMARSKQLGLVFGELFALIIFAGLTVFFALLSRPQGDGGFSGFLIDVFAVLISSVTIFLLTNVWDLQRERSAEQLKKLGGQDENGFYEYVVDIQPEAHGSDRWLSILGGAVIVLAYGGLLGHRYLGWFG